MLEGYVYDTGLPNSIQDLFTMTTHEIAEYVSREYDEAQEFRLGLALLKPKSDKDRQTDCQAEI